MAKAKQTLLKTIQERKLQYFGHLIGGVNTNSTDGRRDRRDKMQRKAKANKGLDKLWTNWCGMSITVAEKRKEWSSMAANLLIQRWHPQ